MIYIYIHTYYRVTLDRQDGFFVTFWGLVILTHGDVLQHVPLAKPYQTAIAGWDDTVVNLLLGHYFHHGSLVSLLQISVRSPSSAELRAFRVVLSMAAALVHPGQPWHLGERTLQLQQKTVASSDEMGPRIYHKVRSKCWKWKVWKCLEKSERTTWPVALMEHFS